MEFENILLQVGGFGKYQRNLTIFVLIPMLCVVPFFWLNFIFMLSVPEHWCYVEAMVSSNLTIQQQRTLISPKSDPSCSMYNRSYGANTTDFNEANGTNIIPCQYGWEYDKANYESTAATKWNMVCGSDHLPALMLSLPNIGSMVLTPVYGLLADKCGRKMVFLALAVVVTVAELASVLVSDVVSLAIWRTINGSVLPSLFSIPFILGMEIVAPKFRAHMNGIFNTCWTVGLCILAPIAYVSRNWINLGLITTAAGFLTLCCGRFLPESPCWLISQGKYERALNVLMKVGERNKKPQNREELLLQLKVLGESIEDKKKDEKKSSKVMFLKYPRLRANFLILVYCSTAFQTSYGGLTYNMINLDGNEFLNFFLLSVVEIPGNILFWFLMYRIGRRWTTSMGFLITGLTSLIPVLGFKYSDVLSTLIGKLLTTGLFMSVEQQCTEIFPTVARSVGIGAVKTISTAFTLFLPYISYLKVYGKTIPFVFISFICIIGGVVSTFLPETHDENLLQTFSDAEEFGRDQKFFSFNRKQLEDTIECKFKEVPTEVEPEDRIPDC